MPPGSSKLPADDRSRGQGCLNREVRMGRWRGRVGVASTMALVLGSMAWLLPARASAWTWAPSMGASAHRPNAVESARTSALARVAVRTAASRPGASPTAVTSVPDGANGQYVAWSDYRDGQSDIYLTRITNNGALASGWPATGVPVCTAPGRQEQAALFSDGANGVILGWNDYRSNELTADAYAQRVNSAGVPLWTANGVKVLAGTLIENDIVGAPDGTGGVFVAWDHSNGSDLDIYAARYDATGALATGWNASGNAVVTAPQNQTHLALAAGAAGSAILSWVDDRNSPAPSNVYAQRLSAAGVAQWTPNGVQLDGGTGFPQTTFMVADGSGGSIVVWNDAFGVLAQRVDPAGVPQWTAGGVTMLGPGSSISMVAPDGLGGAFAAGMGFSGIAAQRVNGAGATVWGATGTAVSSQFAFQFDMVADGSGGGYFAWETINGTTGLTDISAQRLGPGGAPAWGANGVSVTAAPGNQSQPVAEPDGAGGLTVVWVDGRSLSSDLYTQRLDGFGAPLLAADGVPVIVDPGVQAGSFTIADGSGGAILVWGEKRTGGYGIRARHFASNGSPTGASVPVTSLTGFLIAEAAVPDGAGGVLVSWTRWTTDFTTWVQHLDGSLAPQWTASGVMLSPATGFNFGSSIIPDGSGGAIAQWSQESGSPDVYAQRLSAAGAPQWGAGGVALGVGGSASSAAMVPSSGGGAILAFATSTVPGGVFAQRFDGSGGPQWGASPAQILDHPSANTNPPAVHAVSDGAGGVIVLAKYDSLDATNTPTANMLQAQRVNAAGTAQWGADGAVVCGVGALATDEHLLSDGAGGAVAAWSDARSALYDIRAQRVGGAGAALWTANGVLVCGAAHSQLLSDLVSDGSGGAVLAWSDERSGVNDVYAQRVNSSGAAQWTADGVTVCDASGGQYVASAAGDGAGATILSWTDDRAGGTRYIYTQRLTAGGVAAWTGNGVVPALRSLVSAVATPQSVRLVWYSPDRITATVYRQTTSTDWAAIGTVTSDAEGVMVWEDRTVTPGDHVGYRLGVGPVGNQAWFGEAWVDVPGSLALALEGTLPNPAGRDFTVAFTLPVASPATLELFDIAGRSVFARTLDGLPPGRHVLALGQAPASGLYFLRLRQGTQEVSLRAVVAR
jgi:hypothetical protein